MKKKSTHRSSPEVELPEPEDQDPLEDERPPDQELEPEERDPLELCDPL